MFARKKDDKNRRRPGDPSQLGIFGISDDLNNSDQDIDDGSDDEDLEAELLALTAGVTSKPKKRAPPKMKPQDLDQMVAASLKDVPSDGEESVDEDDPDLMAELGELVGSSPTPMEIPQDEERPSVAPSGSQLVSLLKERLQMYEKAESIAKGSGEISRARRFARGIKTLKEQVSQASAGKPVNEADIPPPVATSERPKVEDRNDGKVPPPPGLSPSENPEFPPVPMSQHFPSVPSPSENSKEIPKDMDDGVLATLTDRRNAYRQVALLAKKNGDNDAAIKNVRIVKQFDSVIAAVKSGQPVDLSDMPPMPHAGEPSVPLVPTREAPKPPPRVRTSLVTKAEPQEKVDEVESGDQEPPVPQKAPPPPPPPAPTTVAEALEQRLQRFKEAEQSAKEEGNSSKARRLGRIVKQYQSAITAHKKGQPVDFNELPTPPGFAPIPGQPVPPDPADEDNASKAPQGIPDPSKMSAGAQKPSPSPSSASTSKMPGKTGSSSSISGPGTQQKTRLDRQLDILVKRQAAFKKAALEAKKNGDLAQAREHLRTAKGIDPLIEATQSGLPVDMDTLPLPPDEKAALLETDFDFVSTEECTPGSVAEIYERLEEDLRKQIQMCMNTRDHFRAIGDVSSGNRFEQLALHSKKDLDAVRSASAAHKVDAMAKGEDAIKKVAPPRFHYETKTFSIVRCNTDLSDNDVELTIIRGINYNISNDSDTYVRFEFPYPTETPQKDKTQTIRGNNPTYDQTFLLNMQRTVRSCQRVFKRHSIKMELWSRGGFFRGDSLIGTATVKLQPLETVCDIHDSFPLLDGRKAVGGQMEVKVRLRNPILARQVEKVTEKWLIIDRL